MSDTETTLTAVLDQLIPPRADGSMPGAGALGLAAEMAADAGVAPMLELGLPGLDAIARERGADGFAAAPEAERRAILEELASRDPGFLPGLLFQTCTRYYRHPRVLAALGMPGRPPHPEGYELELGDLGLLDPVRSRTGLYRTP